ncbi:MAG: hypothetical protein JSC188_000634 [Candidatus Tokpelaia sp. JSC188]|nr:MAG: hypothetical protein JSC188_000634 [Candidatus Tokpelaia sp. JSC188]
MTGEISLDQAFEHIHKALNVLENTIESRLAIQDQFTKIEEEMQRVNADRARLAQKLDISEARAEQLELTNKEVSHRLIIAMEKIRAVIEQ